MFTNGYSNVRIYENVENTKMQECCKKYLRNSHIITETVSKTFKNALL